MLNGETVDYQNCGVYEFWGGSRMNEETITGIFEVDEFKEYERLIAWPWGKL